MTPRKLNVLDAVDRPEEPVVMMFEPASTLNTGDAGGALTVAEPKRLDA